MSAIRTARADAVEGVLRDIDRLLAAALARARGGAAGFSDRERHLEAWTAALAPWRAGTAGAKRRLQLAREAEARKRGIARMAEAEKRHAQALRAAANADAVERRHAEQVAREAAIAAARAENLRARVEGARAIARLAAKEDAIRDRSTAKPRPGLEFDLCESGPG